ncbi:MAG TPA: Holliday junction resolvase RuvX [Rhodanobacteraceae bacterium]|nr:Holliday junction resolvase RuvX [Rhodanobacteraceae bacterium]
MARPGERDGDRHILVAFDFGLRRIGIATANRQTRTASPLTTVRLDREPPWRELDRVIDDWRPAQLVVGVPEGDGAAAIARRARAFAAALAERYGLPVATVDETLSSAAAESELAERRRSGYLRRRVGKGGVDRVAACLIAEQWMNEQ